MLAHAKKAFDICAEHFSKAKITHPHGKTIQTQISHKCKSVDLRKNAVAASLFFALGQSMPMRAQGRRKWRYLASLLLLVTWVWHKDCAVIGSWNSQDGGLWGLGGFFYSQGVNVAIKTRCHASQALKACQCVIQQIWSPQPNCKTNNLMHLLAHQHWLYARKDV